MIHSVIGYILFAILIILAILGAFALFAFGCILQERMNDNSDNNSNL